VLSVVAFHSVDLAGKPLLNLFRNGFFVIKCGALQTLKPTSYSVNKVLNSMQRLSAASIVGIFVVSSVA
jgi:hypothetical protein